MDKAWYLVQAHLVEGRPVAELAAAHGVHRSWLYKLIARIALRAEPGSSPDHDDPTTHPLRWPPSSRTRSSGCANSSSRKASTPTGATPRSTNFGTVWRRARAKVGREDLHFHDMRHFANTLAAAAGASTKELMARLGHSSPAAALRYQHATAERDRAIADRIDAMIGPVRAVPDTAVG